MAAKPFDIGIHTYYLSMYVGDTRDIFSRIFLLALGHIIELLHDKKNFYINFTRPSRKYHLSAKKLTWLEAKVMMTLDL